MAQTISYSDFLKEGALQEQNVIQDQESDKNLKPFHIPAEDVATDSELKAFWKQLRHFFRTGERPKGENGVLIPALIAPYLRNASWDTEYPYYLSPGNERGSSLEALIREALNEVFAEKEARILRQNLPRLISYFRKNLNRLHGSQPFPEAKKATFADLGKLEVHDEEGKRFRADIEKLSEALPNNGIVMDFSHEIPLFIIRQNLERIEQLRSAYKNAMRKRAEELRELLKLDEDKEGRTGEADARLGFADDLIAMDKVRSMMPRKGSSLLSDARVERIKSLIDILDDTLNSQENRAHLLVNNELQHDFRWQEIFVNSKVSFAELGELFKRVEEIFDANIGSFTRVIIAMRKSELELEGRYDAEVHEDYFNHFKWFKLDPEELALFPPVILVTGGFHLLRDGMSHFSNLMVSNKPIKVLAITNRTTNEINPEVDWEEASHSYRQELAAIALSHRGAHTLQCAIDKPGYLRSGMAAAINTSSPALMHLLIPDGSADPMVSFLKINAAATGRFFPYLAYDCQQGSEWGSRFDITANAQPDRNWATYEFKHQAADESEVSLDLPFSYADYKAMSPEKVEELMLVPESMLTDYLVPIHEYLELSQTELTGKVPFIWLIGEDNAMHRAALPYMWAQSCKERLDFWNFVQELGGVNSYHVKLALEREKVNWEKEKEEELQALRKRHEAELNETWASAAGEAMERLTDILLGEEAPLPQKPVVKKAEPSPEVAEQLVKDEKPVASKEQKKPGEKPDKAATEEATEPYVDSFRCTSCNDCIEKFPTIFEYNEDKQAEVKEDYKGSFEDLVIAAEACPASCIHPGDPQDLTEPGLDELRKRAAKFN